MKIYQQIVKQSIKDSSEGNQNSIYDRIKDFTDGLTNKELIALMTKEEIYYKKTWNRELLVQKYYGMANINYALMALQMIDIINETFQEFSNRLYIKFYAQNE